MSPPAWSSELEPALRLSKSETAWLLNPPASAGSEPTNSLRCRIPDNALQMPQLSNRQDERLSILQASFHAWKPR